MLHPLGLTAASCGRVPRASPWADECDPVGVRLVRRPLAPIGLSACGFELGSASRAYVFFWLYADVNLDAESFENSGRSLERDAVILVSLIPGNLRFVNPEFVG